MIDVLQAAGSFAANIARAALAIRIAAKLATLTIKAARRWWHSVRKATAR